MSEDQKRAAGRRDEPFGYWIEQKNAEPVLLRKPSYIPEPSDLRTITPLFASSSAEERKNEIARLREALAPFAAVADEWDRWQAKGSTSKPTMIRMYYGRCQVGLSQYQAARAALAAGETA